MKKFDILSYYVDDMNKLQTSSAHFGDSIADNFPHLSHQLHKANVLPIAYTTPYFLTLFAYNCPLSICAHFWDLILFSEILFCNKICVEQLIKDFILLYIGRKHKEWKKLHIHTVFNKLRTFDIDKYEMSIIIQEVINSHQLENEDIIMQKLSPLLQKQLINSSAKKINSFECGDIKQTKDENQCHQSISNETDSKISTVDRTNIDCYCFN